MSHWILFTAIFRKELSILKSYSFNLAMNVLSIYILFLFIFYGIGMVALPETFGETQEGIIAGFFLWISAIIASSQISDDLVEEARIGTLEQVAMSKFDIVTVVIFKAFSLFLQNFLIIIPVLLLMMLTTGRWLHIDILSLILPFFFAMASVWGFAFMLAGLALIFKRIGAIFQLVQWFLLGCVVASASTKLSIFLPLAMGTNLMSQIMVGGLSLIDLPPFSMVILIANGAFYFAAGSLVFKQSVKVAKKRGLLGQY